MKKIVFLGLVLVLMGCDSKEVKEYKAAVKARESHEKFTDSYTKLLDSSNKHCTASLRLDQYYHSLNSNEPLITIATQKTCEDVDVLKKLVNEEMVKHDKLLEKEKILRQKAGR
ncbi:MAG: hypothetical protein KAZ18_00110 [Acinetobacter sp.]|nr:hypothetical protein [Acinetobacter sp.]